MLFDIGRYYPQIETLVIDDGSADNTGKIAKANNSRIIFHTKNMGKGFALKEGISYALNNNFKWIVTLDGDGQHKPVHIKKFLCKIAAERYDLILGNRRDRLRRMPIHRQLSNGITSLLISLIGGNKRIRDSQCGFRAYRVGKFIEMPSHQHGFQFESEVLIWALKSGLRISEVDIDTVYGETKSSINLIKDTTRFIKLVLRTWIRA